MIVVSKYNFRRALRPFSLSVSLVACLTGILSAYREGFYDPLNAVLVVVAGLLLQSGVNLINDYADGAGMSADILRRVRRNFFCGLIAFLLATLIAIYLVLQTGAGLLWLVLAGVLGAIGYTMEPINYKRRGLGVPLVFLLMGIMMVCGAYYVQSGHYSVSILLQSVPVSLLVAMLLLSNELRDHETDSDAGVTTLTVRLGYVRAMWLFRAGMLLAFAMALILALLQVLPAAWLVTFTLPLVTAPWRLSGKRDATERRMVTVMTGRLLAGFGFFYCAAFLVGLPG